MIRITRDRRLSPEEAAKYSAIRGQVEIELPEIISRHYERMSLSPLGRSSMSHYRFFDSFRDGQGATFPLAPLITALERHGCTVQLLDGKDKYFVAPPINERGNDEIGFEATVLIKEGGTRHFGIHRPYYDEKFLSLATCLICDLGLCMSSDADPVAYIRNEDQRPHLPEEIRSKAKVIRSREELEIGLFADDESPEAS